MLSVNKRPREVIEMKKGKRRKQQPNISRLKLEVALEFAREIEAMPVTKAGSMKTKAGIAARLIEAVLAKRGILR